MNWFPKRPPLYDIKKTYLENATLGPFFEGELPERIYLPEKEWIDFLGFKIASPIGVPAGPLLNARWIQLASSLQFDVLTYKTIRSFEFSGHPLPNMIYVDTFGMITDEHMPQFCQEIGEPAPNIEELAVTNSFGMPSRAPDYLLKDIPAAKSALQKGQVLIVSVTGTVRSECTFLEDFVLAARLAKEAGADLIEANFSCPNIGKKEGLLYTSPDVVKAISSALVQAIHPIPLILKVGRLPTFDQMREMMITAARSGVKAIAGINTVSMQVRTKEGLPALGPTRLTGGICGGPIRQQGLQFVKDAHQIRTQEKLDLKVIGCGGITLAEHFDQYLQAGADLATAATGMMWDPYLANRYHKTKTSDKISSLI
ncbi:MAG TPA: tRNA-dihydrouridine synthase [Rhabdochlamydiaceae bacterium]|nr:tRNA-dihydrouridine synthase [Rhabdochlamydiaceae bacterium]